LAWFFLCGLPGAARRGFSDGLRIKIHGPNWIIAEIETISSMRICHLGQRTEANFEARRRDHESRAEIRAFHARGEKLPSEMPSSLTRRVCGVTFDSHKPTESYDHRVYIYAAWYLRPNFHIHENLSSARVVLNDPTLPTPTAPWVSWEDWLSLHLDDLATVVSEPAEKWPDSPSAIALDDEAKSANHKRIWNGEYPIAQRTQ
jgi:hypothetical protein